ncbi:MAG: hypothetical protein ACJ8FY_28335 [Gemmataceae bacterium]
MLLDTDVLVDILRSHPPALAWLKSLTNAPIALAGLAAMELVTLLALKGESDPPAATAGWSLRGRSPFTWQVRYDK